MINIYAIIGFFVIVAFMIRVFANLTMLLLNIFLLFCVFAFLSHVSM